MSDVARYREFVGDVRLSIREHDNGEFTFLMESGDNTLSVRVSKAEARRFARFITSTK